MKKVFLTLLAVVFVLSLQAQHPAVNTGVNVMVNDADAMPEYEGGMEKFYKRLKRIPYTYWDRLNLRKGKVYLLMAIESDGRLSDLKVVRGLSVIQDKEILRVAKKLDRWKPATKNGIPVRVVCSVPINFELLDKVDPDSNFNVL
ncbi:energy transducer TonB [Mucilaginibacter auburnensis]|uniref:TonB-like protein n=1 Tax=Mucilaginibacter auburnensis TaxID=1457233 RepID=A0A2H9VVH1_9SPHI|nr:energy transducer TonB [Mucilaginibacter auburnensis]PJJ84818.1 TonB-like protein [Mucilaginibacter auburnensis]